MLYLHCCYFSFKLCQIQCWKPSLNSTFKTCANTPWWCWWWKPDMLCSCSQPVVHDVPCLTTAWCPSRCVSWQQCPHSPERCGDGPKLSVLRLTVFLRDRQRPAYIGLRGSHGPAWQQHHHCQGRSEDGPRSEGMDPVYPCWSARLTRDKGRFYLVQCYAAGCQEPPCLQSWWPSVTALARARETATRICFGPKSCQLTNSVFVYQQKTQDHHHHPREEKRQHGSAYFSL